MSIICYYILDLVEELAMEALDAHHRFIKHKLREYYVLVTTCRLPPRLQDRILSTIRTYEDTENERNLNVVESRRSLRVLRDQIEEHWRQIYGDISKAASFFEQLMIFRMFLHSKLLEDYVGVAYTVNVNILNLCRCNGDSEDRKQASLDLRA